MMLTYITMKTIIFATFKQFALCVLQNFFFEKNHINKNIKFDSIVLVTYIYTVN